MSDKVFKQKKIRKVIANKTKKKIKKELKNTMRPTKKQYL